jgi:hypothetical protein
MPYPSLFLCILGRIAIFPELKIFRIISADCSGKRIHALNLPFSMDKMCDPYS